MAGLRLHPETNFFSAILCSDSRSRRDTPVAAVFSGFPEFWSGMNGAMAGPKAAATGSQPAARTGSPIAADRVTAC